MMEKKLVVIDLLKESVLVFNIDLEIITVDEYLEELFVTKYVSMPDHLQWYVMDNIVIRNYCKHVNENQEIN